MSEERMHPSVELRHSLDANARLIAEANASAEERLMLRAEVVRLRTPPAAQWKPTKCQFQALNHGVAGNENIVNGITMCDYCPSLAMQAYPRAAPVRVTEVSDAMVEAGARACWEVSRGDEKPWESATNIERVTFLDYSRLTLTAALNAERAK